jgi:hypothetical protein
MDITKTAVVEPPKSTAPPVKAQPQPEHRASRGLRRLRTKMGAPV